MKIIKDNCKHKNKVTRLVCNHCGSVLEITEEDKMFSGMVQCPCCGYLIPVDSNEEKRITINNVDYPKDFTTFKNGVDIPKETIEKWIRDCCKAILERGEDFYFIASGNSLVFACLMNEDGEKSIYIVVAKEYCDTEVEVE